MQHCYIISGRLTYLDDKTCQNNFDRILNNDRTMFNKNYCYKSNKPFTKSQFGLIKFKNAIYFQVSDSVTNKKVINENLKILTNTVEQAIRGKIICTYASPFDIVRISVSELRKEKARNGKNKTHENDNH